MLDDGAGATRLVHAIGPLPCCPSCEGTDFLVLVGTAGTIAFACLCCGAEWRYGLGYVWRVDDASRATPAATPP